MDTNYNAKDFLEIINRFQEGQELLNMMELEIIGGENDLDPLLALRFYKEDHTLENSVALSCAMVSNKEVIIRHSETRAEVLRFAYSSGDITLKFKKCPWLLDTFFSMCYGILLKKLTPPSIDTLSAESGSVPSSTTNAT